MAIASGVFVVLFLFLVCINSIVVAASFVRKKEDTWTPHISIVIPTHNEAKNIAHCLASIISGDYPRNKYELIVVDDGSTDKTSEVVELFQNVRLIKTKHEGKTAALNKGLKAAKEEFIITIDADTILEPDALKKLISPLKASDVGVVVGLTKVKKAKGLLNAFQNVEYLYNNLVRMSFSKLFKNTIWVHGALTCYKKSVLERNTYFKRDTLAEDLDLSLELYHQGYRTVVSDGSAYTNAPKTMKHLLKQRVRWCTGVLQCMKKHHHLFRKNTSPSILFMFLNQWWWSLFAVISFPIVLLQIAYWFPQQGSMIDVLLYFFRWFSLSGPVYVLYHLPNWGFSWYNFFGVMSGIITTIFMIGAIIVFKERVYFKNIVALFFYFPYTILLNTAVVAGLARYKFYKPTFFIR